MGESLPFPGASIDKDFAWAEKGHPVADFYRASGAIDTPGLDLAAILYAVRPDSFQVVDKKLTVPAGQRQKIIDTFIEIASAKPVARPGPGRRPQQPPPAKQEKKTP